MTRRQAAVAGLLVVCVLLVAALTRQRPVLGGLPPAAPPTPAGATPTSAPRRAAPPTPARHEPARRTVALAAQAQPIRLPRSSDVALPVDSPPSVSPALIDATLAREGSPLAGLGAYICAEGRHWHVDPVFLLAFVTYFDAAHPLAVSLHNVGHIRAGGTEPAVDGYRAFATWRQGIGAWYGLIHKLYVNRWHLRTLDEILPIYAPGAGRLDVEAEVNALRDTVAAWRGATS